jgi:translation initiation factor IF-2
LPEKTKEILELVVKADTTGMEEAIRSSIENLDNTDVTVKVIYSGTGDISKTDLLMAETSGKFVMGFNVELLPGIRKLAAQKKIEIRLYNVIYMLLDDLGKIAQSMASNEEEEELIKGRARVIALFPGSRKSVILGCEVYEGELALGSKFRIISEPGIIYSGTIGSLHIEANTVNKAVSGQQAGIKISGFRSARKGDILESFEEIHHKRKKWRPDGTVRDLRTSE